jgi:hypothetical protein
MSELRNSRLRWSEATGAGQAVIITGSTVLFALIVVVILANPPGPNTLFFTGGWRAGLFGLAMLSLVPLIVMVQFALGVAFTRVFVTVDEWQAPWFLWLSGSAIMSLVGVAVAVAGGLNPWICGSLFVLGVAYAVGPARRRVSHVLVRTLEWLRLKDIASSKPAFGFVRVGIVAAVVLIGLRAATGELNDTDVVQFYWGWLNEVRHLGGIWLSPERPLIQDFVVGRGNGTYLLFAGLAPGLVVHVVSAGYSILFAVILREFVLKATADFSIRSEPLSILAADLACLAGLWMMPGAVSFGKYHLQFAAWALGFLLAALTVAKEDGESAHSHRFSLFPLAIALPIALAQFEAFVVLVVGLAALTSRSGESARRLVPLAVIGIVSGGLSLLANWFYLGIPDLNPFPLFEHFISELRFDLWTSRLQQYFLNYIQAGVFTFHGGDGVGAIRELRTLLSELVLNLMPLLVGAAGISIAAFLSWRLKLSGQWGRWVAPLFGLILGYSLYRVSLLVNFSELATGPIFNQLAGYAGAITAYLLVVVRRVALGSAARFALALLGYWLICESFVLAFHSGNLERLIRHADAVAVGLLLIGLVYAKERIPRLLVPSAPIVLLLVGAAVLFSLRAAVFAAAVEPPWHLVSSMLGLRGRAVGLTNPIAKFERCREIATSVPADARALFLNAYTAMAYCNNAILLPRTMIVHQYQSDYARDIAKSIFADADTVERTLQGLRINYFLVLKGDSEFWASGFSAPFRPGELESRFDLVADTPSFYVLTWRGLGKPIPTDALAAITEWRRIGIQQHGFMWNNEFVGQWRAMANLGADRPKYELGSRLDFTSRGWSALYADHGWYAAESAGTWTLGPRAILTLPFEQPATGALEVNVELTPFLVPQLPSRRVRVQIDGHNVATWTFKLGDATQVRTVELAADLVRNKAQVVFTFEIENSLSPYALNVSPDWRPVGIMVRSLTVREAGAVR